MSQPRSTYRVTFHQGVTMVFSFPGDLPKTIFDAVEQATKAGGRPGLLLLDDPRMVLDLSAIAAVHLSTDSTETQH